MDAQRAICNLVVQKQSHGIVILSGHSVIPFAGRLLEIVIPDIVIDAVQPHRRPRHRHPRHRRISRHGHPDRGIVIPGIASSRASTFFTASDIPVDSLHVRSGRHHRRHRLRTSRTACSLTDVERRRRSTVAQRAIRNIRWRNKLIGGNLPSSNSWGACFAGQLSSDSVESAPPGWAASTWDPAGSAADSPVPRLGPINSAWARLAARSVVADGTTVRRMGRPNVRHS